VTQPEPPARLGIRWRLKARNYQRLADPAAFGSVAQAALGLPFDFPALQAQVADDAFELSPADLPGHPFALTASRSSEISLFPICPVRFFTLCPFSG
jgi:hypothetical protein